MHEDAGARTALAPAPAPVLGSDPHDFAGLYIRHRSSFTSHARRYLRDPRDADEVVQEAFLRLFLAMPELETELQALAYCRRTITNLCIDRYRADARRPRLVALDGSPADDLAEDDTGDPVVRAEDAALVRQALSQLPELHRAALIMREIEEKPLPVIADELDVAEDSVKHLLYRARRHLRKLLAGTSVAPGVDLELTRGLRPVARGASGGVAGLVLLALLGLGSGPDLRAVPVVGVDLPDVLGVTAVVDAVRDVVSIVVPAVRPQEASAAARRSGPVSRSQDVTGPSSATPAGEQPAPVIGSTTVTPSAGRAAQPGPAGGGGTRTVVTVVDGRPVVTAVPVPGVPIPGAPTAGVLPPAPRTGVLPVAPGTSTGRGGSPYVPVPVTAPPTVVRDIPVRTPAGVVLPPAAAAGRPSGSDSPGRPARADDVPPRTGEAAGPPADRIEKAAEKADRAADRVADKVAAAAERAQDKAERAPEHAAQKAEQAAASAAAKAEQAADKAQRAAEKGAQQASAKAERAADKAQAQRAAAQAAEAAAARAAAVASAAVAAEQAAAAAAAAEQAAAASPVSSVATTVAPLSAP